MEIDMFSMQMSLTIFTMKKKVTECWEFVNLRWSESEQEEENRESVNTKMKAKLSTTSFWFRFGLKLRLDIQKKNIQNVEYVLVITLHT